MSLVVDASVLVASLVDPGHDGRWSRAALSQDGLCAPAHVLAEATNALRRMELSGRIARVQAAAAHRDLLRDDYTLYPFPPFAERVWELRTTLTCYDAWYVALAEALSCPLATLDRRLGRASGPTCEFVAPPPM